MQLFHVSLSLEPKDKKLFTPRVPESTAFSEDQETPRICLADSIIHCIEAILPKGISIHSGMLLQVYTVNISEDDTYLLSPKEVHRHVADALFTQEYWYLQPISMESHVYRIEDITILNCINVSALSLEEYKNLTGTVLNNVLDLDKLYLNSPDHSVEELNKRVHLTLAEGIGGLITESQCRRLSETIWDLLATVEQAQAKRVTKLSLQPVCYNYE